MKESVPICRRHSALLFLALVIQPISSRATLRVLEAMKPCRDCVTAGVWR